MPTVSGSFILAAHLQELAILLIKQQKKGGRGNPFIIIWTACKHSQYPLNVHTRRTMWTDERVSTWLPTHTHTHTIPEAFLKDLCSISAFLKHNCKSSYCIPMAETWLTTQCRHLSLKIALKRKGETVFVERN